MTHREKSKSHAVEVQKGKISLDEQYSSQLRREPECTMRDLENNRMRLENMTMTFHTPKQ